MPAGGFKTFIPGVLDSSDVNDYLMQGVLVFDDASTRNSAIGTAVEGMVAYTRDDDTVRLYDGSTWVVVSPTPGPRICGSATGVTNTGLTISVTIPSETVAGDLLVAVTATIGGSGESATGWTFRERIVSGASNFSVLCTYTRVATSTDAGTTVTFTVSGINTTGCAAILTLHNPLEVSNIHGYDDAAGSGSTITAPAPTSALGRKPLRLDVFASYNNNNFTGYTGTGNLLVNTVSNFNRLQVYTTYDSGSSTASAAVTSGGGNWTAASFRVRG